MNFISKK